MNTPEKKLPQSQQLALFQEAEAGGTPAVQTPATPEINARSSFGVVLGAFERYMEQRGFTENTQQAFRLDMRLLADYLGPGTTLGQIGTANLKAFITWMKQARGVPCSPKTLERRITTLKVFFGWLAEEGVLPRDPAAPLIHRSVSAPLPEVLDDAEMQAVLAVTQAMRQGDEQRKADPRPHLLVTLLLHTGIKKGECVRIVLNHLDVSDSTRPALWVRYATPGRRRKERRIVLPAQWLTIFQEYLAVYKTRQFLFPWTARNLEYVLTKVGQEADIARLTFEMLRWTCALRDYVEGMDQDALRQKLGLSDISWYEVEPKLALLAQQTKFGNLVS